jgi:hypothetical protein
MLVARVEDSWVALILYACVAAKRTPFLKEKACQMQFTLDSELKTQDRGEWFRVYSYYEFHSNRHNCSDWFHRTIALHFRPFVVLGTRVNLRMLTLIGSAETSELKSTSI